MDDLPTGDLAYDRAATAFERVVELEDQVSVLKQLVERMSARIDQLERTVRENHRGSSTY